MKPITISILLLMGCLAPYAQSWDAETYYASGYWAEAAREYQKEITEKTPPYQQDEYYQKIGVSYYHLKDYQSAYEAFIQVSSPSQLSEEGLTTYYEVLRTQKKYPQAERILKNASNSSLVKVDLPKSNNIAQLNVVPQMLEANFGRHFIGLNLSGDKAIFSFPHKNQEDQTEYYDLYETSIDNSGEIEVANKKLLIKDKRKVYYRGAPTAIDYNGHTSYIYCGSMSEHDRYKLSKEGKRSLSDSGYNNLALFRAYLNDSDEWESTEITSLNKKGHNSVTPYFDKATQTLYFSSDQSGTGGYDIYSTQLQQDNDAGGNWSQPKQVTHVNSAADDVFPFIHNNQLYFSSRGHQTYGGLDLFKSPITGGEVKNLGTKVNSSYDDFSMVWKNDSTGYFASNKASEKGKDKLYLFYSVQELIYCQFNNQNGEPIDGKLRITFDNGDTEELLVKGSEPFNYHLKGRSTSNISFEDTYGNIKDLALEDDFELEDKETQVVYTPTTVVDQFEPMVANKVTSEPIHEATVIIKNITTGEEHTLTTNEEGKWNYPYQAEESYLITVSKENFTTHQIQVQGKDISNLFLDPTDNIEVLRIQNIVFDFDSHQLQERSYAILDEVTNYLNKYPDVTIELSAHTDCHGTDRYNQRLSDRRAKTCKKYLIKSGIDSSRLTPVGYGEKYIINGCTEEGQCSKEQNEENRRVEIKILNK